MSRGQCARLAVVLGLAVSFLLSLQWNHSLVASIHPKPRKNDKDNDNDDNNKALHNRNLTYVYSVMRKDRSGMMILEMLEAHAYAYARRKRLRYGGACQVAKKVTERTLGRYNVTRSILERLGLDRELPFLRCPSANKPGRIVPRDEYDTREMNRLWPRDWIRHMQAQLNFSDRLRDDDVSWYRVAVHVRRGDVSPCKHRDRYLPNAHYRRLLDRYVPRNQRSRTKVQVFSETDSFEPWSEFRAPSWRNVTVEFLLDTPLADVWESIVTADLVILSKSSFGFVPAMLNRHGRVIYSPFPRKKLSAWEKVPKKLMRQANDEIFVLAQKCPS